MNLIEFTKILHNPNLLSKDDSESLENIIREFPYFQAARVLHLNSLKKQSSFKYNAALKKTAAYTTDRSILFDFITTDDFTIEKYITKEEQQKKENKAATEKPVTDKKTEVVQKNEVKEPVSRDDKVLPIGKPIPFKKNDSFSFNEWLNLTSMTPLRGENTDKKAAGKLSKKEELVDRFIKTNPKIKPSRSSDVTDYSQFSTVENENLMTETLAHVYLEQKKYTKAITAFRILSLKYPEKSSFFANQIEEIEKLQKNKS